VCCANEKPLRERQSGENAKWMIACSPAFDAHPGGSAIVMSSSSPPTTTLATRRKEIERHGRAAFAALQPKLDAEREAFALRLRGGLARCAEYEDEVAKTCAMSAMPMEAIEKEAKEIAERVSSSGDDDVGGGSDRKQLEYEDAKLLAVLAWFKREFFVWVDKPKCEGCGDANTRLLRTETVDLTAEEREGEASRVEVYECTACVAQTRFPRFNSAIKLLETRRGRCGEWANAFTLCCRALGFRARWVLDWTDHVWTEVYSEAQQRWLHCDPCENVCDKPLLYEVGWGKKHLSYIIAFSIEGVVDVTKRYTRDMQARYRSRGAVSETWLRQRLAQLTNELRSAMLPDEVRQLEAQDKLEQAELNKPAIDVGESLPGRATGSYAWRKARGELGNL